MTDPTPTRVPPPALPSLREIPRDEDQRAAARTVELAAELVANVTTWAKVAVPAADFETAGEVRRAVSEVADVIVKRNLSKAAALDAQIATRTAERVLGLTLRAGQDAGRVRKRGDSRSSLPSAKDFCGTGGGLERSLRLAEPTDEVFTNAIEAVRVGGSASFDSFVAALGHDGRSAEELARRDHVASLAARGLTSAQIAAEMGTTREYLRALARRFGVEIPGDKATARAKPIDVERVLEESLATLEGVATSVGLIPAEAVAEMAPEKAADAARAMWTALVPIMNLRKGLNDRGREQH